MNGHPRKRGILETRPRSAKPPTPWKTNAPPFREDETAGKWLIFNQSVYCIGDMYPVDYRKWVQSHCSTATQAAAILGKIDVWDRTAYWFCALELLYRGKITLYDSRQAAEAAMRRTG